VNNHLDRGLPNSRALLRATLLASLLGGCGASGLPAATPAADPGWTVVPGVTLVEANTEADCGAAALRMVLGRWTPDVPATVVESEVLQALGPPDSGTGYRAGSLRDVARAHGFNAFVIEGQLADLVHEVRLGRPVIVGIVTTRLGKAYTHYQVVTGTDASGAHLLIADPRGTWSRVRAEDFLAEWRPTGQVALVMFPATESVTAAAQ
jgi:ABC-type bacteriocin/lantibiotic exporter with double-glycine peptidase domain